MKFLDIDVQHEVKISLQSLIGESIAVLGIKGSGKTNTAAVLIEELLANELPLTIVDIEGEYWGLKEKFEVFVIGKSANVDIPVEPEQAGYFAEFSVKQGISLILDLSDFDPNVMHEFLLRYFEALWRAEFNTRRPYQVVLEEAHEFVPQSVRTPLKELLTRIALRGRKRGLGLVSISQRSAKVEKDVLTQAAILFLHRVVHPIDIKVYQDILPLPPREVEARVASLRRGDAIVMVNDTVLTAHIRVRHTFHAGATPELQPSQRPKLRNINNTLLAELRQLATRAGKTAQESSESSRLQRLAQEISKRDQQIAIQQGEIERLKSQVDLLSNLRLTVDGNSIPMAEVGKSVGDLSVERLTATHLITANTSKEPIGSITNTTPLNARQQSRFEYLLTDVQQLPRFQRAMLIFLTEREGTAFSTQELARWLRISASTIENRPPRELIKMGLIVRKGTRGHYRYEASVHRQMAAMFPELDTDYLANRLLQSIK